MPDPSSRLIKARVVKAYAKRAANELSLSVGDELLVFDATNASMWYGKIISHSDGQVEAEEVDSSGGAELQTGWFPAGNCVPVGAPPLPNHPSNTSNKGGVRLSMRIDAATFRNQLTAALGDPGIVVGSQIPGVPSPRLRKHARALHDYAAESPSELSIKAGEIISLLSCDENESWWEGELASGAIGYFPKDFVQVFRDPSSMATPRVAPVGEKAVDYSEFEDPHALAIIAQVVNAHEPVVPTNDSGTPFLALPEGAVVALLDSNPNHMYWMAVHFNNNMAPTRKSLEQGTTIDISTTSSTDAKTASVGLIPKSNLAVFEGLADPRSNYPFEPVPLSLTRVLANRALGSVQTSEGHSACLARIAFEFFGENENEHEYLGVGDLVWVIDDDDAVKSEAWIEVEVDTRRGFCPASFVEVLSDRVQTPKVNPPADGENPVPGHSTLESIQEYDVPETASNDGDGASSSSPASQSHALSTDSPVTSDSPAPDALTRIHNLSVSSMPSQAPPPTPNAATSTPTLAVPSNTSPAQSAASTSPISDTPPAASTTPEASSSGKKSKKKSSKESKESKETHTTEGPHSTFSATLARSLYSYTAESNNELSLNVGDIVRLIDYPANEEWWEGMLMAPDGSALAEENIGFFPRDYVVILATPEHEKKKKRPKRGHSISGSKKKKVSSTAATKDSESDENTETPTRGSKSKRLEAEIESLKSQIDSMALDAEAKQAELESVLGELEAAQAELRSTKLALENAKQESQMSTADLASSKADLAALRRSFSNLEIQHKDVTEQVTKVEQVKDEALDSLRAEIALWRSRAEAAESSVTSLQAQLAAATTAASQAPPSSAPSVNPSSVPQNPSPAAAAGPPPTSALPATPKTRGALPPTPTTTPGGGLPRVLSQPPKMPSTTAPHGSPASLGPVPPLPAAGAPKRSLPPTQPAPSLPAEFVKKTAAPTSGIRAASHISAQSVAAGAKKSALPIKRTAPTSGMQHSGSNYSNSSTGTGSTTPTSSTASSPTTARRKVGPGPATPVSAGAQSSQSASPASTSNPGTPTHTTTPSSFRNSNSNVRISSYAKHGSSVNSSSNTAQPPPKVLDEFENKRRFFESLK